MRPLVLAALIALAGPVAEAAPCSARLAPGKPVSLTSPLDERERLGVGWSAILALSPPTREWPFSTLDPAACEAGTFKVGPAAWTLRRGAGEAPAMWAKPADGPGLAILVLAPSVDEGFEYSEANPKPEPLQVRHPGYVLAVVQQRRWLVTRLYDAAPSPAQVMSDMAAALEGRAATIASFDPDGAAVSFAVPTQSDERAILGEPRPGEGGNPARLWAPDNRLFARLADGSVRMDGSQFLCPRAAGVLPLADLWVANVTEARRDLACRYLSGGDSVAVFVTRRAERPDIRRIYDGYVDEIRGQHTLTGPVAPPLTAGAPPGPAHAGAWTTSERSAEGLWVAAVGDWYIEVRATYSPSDGGRVGAAVGDLFASAFRTIHPPPAA